MTDFTTVTLTQKPLDPYDRVHYSTGMVLGVDEFVQEQLYLMESDRVHNRSLHGYGTVCGLSVRYDEKTRMVVVTPGLAVDPAGQKIRIPVTQCADLDTWLTRNREQVLQRTSSPPSQSALFVVLSFRECKTGKIPIPGKPCRSEEESMAPSRITDDFDLSFSFDSPLQAEEEAVRDFRRFLAQFEIVSSGGITRDAMEACVRQLKAKITSPPGSLPCTGPFRINSSQACEILNAAYRTWVTEVRPEFMGGSEDCMFQTTAERGLLLAELQFDLSEESGRLKAGNVRVLEDDRPVLLQTRLLQEQMICGRQGAGSKGAINATTGTVTLSALGQAQVKSPPIPHGLGTSFVIIDLALESGGQRWMGDIAGFPSQVKNVPNLAAVIDINNAGQFHILLKDNRAAGSAAQPYVIRWWAIPGQPATQSPANPVAPSTPSIAGPGTTIPVRPPIRGNLRDSILSLIRSANGITLTGLIRNLGANESEIQPILDELKTSRAVTERRKNFYPA